jgi:hypothetical protein
LTDRHSKSVEKEVGEKERKKGEGKVRVRGHREAEKRERGKEREGAEQIHYTRWIILLKDRDQRQMKQSFRLIIIFS